jgi:hypothetical protein
MKQSQEMSTSDRMNELKAAVCVMLAKDKHGILDALAAFDAVLANCDGTMLEGESGDALAKDMFALVESSLESMAQDDAVNEQNLAVLKKITTFLPENFSQKKYISVLVDVVGLLSEMQIDDIKYQETGSDLKERIAADMEWLSIKTRRQKWIALRAQLIDLLECEQFMQKHFDERMTKVGASISEVGEHMCTSSGNDLKASVQKFKSGVVGADHMKLWHNVEEGGVEITNLQLLLDRSKKTLLSQPATRISEAISSLTATWAPYKLAKDMFEQIIQDDIRTEYETLLERLHLSYAEGLLCLAYGAKMSARDLKQKITGVKAYLKKHQVDWHKVHGKLSTAALAASKLQPIKLD